MVTRESLSKWLQTTGTADVALATQPAEAQGAEEVSAGAPSTQASSGYSLHDSAYDAFASLSRLGDDDGEPVAPQLIGECIATYRLLLGRDPDPSGFRSFVETRRALSLAQTVSGICTSAEAADRFTPFAVPPAGEVALATTQLSLTILTGITAELLASDGGDPAVGGPGGRPFGSDWRARLERIEQRIDQLTATAEAMEQQLARVSDYIMLRLDAGQP